MAAVLVPGLRLEASSTIKRLRELPIAGEILVKHAEQVTSSTIVGRSNLPGELLVLRLPELMGLQIFEIIAALKVKVGQKVEQEQLLVEFSGLFGLLKTRYHAPCAGIIEFFSERTAHLGLRKPAWPIELQAYISGTVKDISPGRSVTIESQCSFIQGIFGLGGERCGKLKMIAKPEQQITAEMIPDNSKDCVLFGGMRPDLQAIQKAVRSGACGFVTGSLDDQLIKAYLGYDLGIAITGDEKVPMTLIMTEGFGEIPMSQRVFDLLNACDGQEASINGATQVRAGAVRPEIIIPHEIGEAVQPATLESGLEVGRRVRVIRVPYFGQVGEVIDLPVKSQQIETGAFARVLQLRLTDQRVVTVPRANVELI